MLEQTIILDGKDGINHKQWCGPMSKGGLEGEKKIIHGPQGKLGFWSSEIVLYCHSVIMDKIEHTDTCGFEHRRGYSIWARYLRLWVKRWLL